MADSRIDELRRRLERDPGSRLFAQLAEEHRKAGDLGEAIRVSRAGLAQHPNYPSARLTLGRALLESGDPGAARGELEAALRDAPDNILASRFLGEALEALGDLGSALVQYRATLKVAPGDRHVEGRIRGIETRLGAPRPATAAGNAPGGDVTSPLRGRATPVPPGPATAAPVPTKGDDGRLPPTIRIHMPVEPAGPWARAGPQPPPVPPSPVGRAQVPPQLVATARIPPPPGPSGASQSPPGPPSPAPPPPTTAGPFYESDQAPTLGTARAPELVPPEETTPATLPPQRLAGERTPGRESHVDVAAASTTPGVSRVPPPITPGTRVAEAVEPAAPLSSTTLAELYFGQGLVDRAIEVYGRLLQEEPGNEKARVRLAELQGLAGGTGGVAARAARQRALERTIADLEKLLSAVRRRR